MVLGAGQDTFFLLHKVAVFPVGAEPGTIKPSVQLTAEQSAGEENVLQGAVRSQDVKKPGMKTQTAT